MAALICTPPCPILTSQITNYGWSTSEACLRPPRSEPSSSASRTMIDRQGEFTQGPAVCQTDRRRPLRQGPIGFPTGHSESGWSDNVCADVERKPDSTSSSENLTQTFRSQRPRIPRLATRPAAHGRVSLSDGSTARPWTM